MKFVPRHNQIIGRMVIKKMTASIIRPDESKDTTKFVLIDALGPGAEAEGLKVGDVVVPNTLGHIVLDGGVSFRPILEEKHVVFVVTDVNLSDLVIQNESANKYVSFDAADAAKSLGELAGQAEPKSVAA